MNHSDSEDNDKHHYGKLCTLIYDLDKPYAEAQEVEVYVKHIAAKNAKVLEAMCGSGRFLIPVLRIGYNVSGFDSSQEMLHACSDKCKELGMHPQLFSADITDFKCSEMYDYVFITAGSVSLLTTASDLFKAFSNVYDCLLPGGSFIFTYVNYNCRIDDCNEWKETMRFQTGSGEISCKEKISCDREGHTAIYEYLYELWRESNVIDTEYQKLPLKSYLFTELKSVLEECGYTDICNDKVTVMNNECSMVICRKQSS